MGIMFTNDAQSTLAVAIGAGDTTVVLAAGGGAPFPQPTVVGDYFLLTLENRFASPIVREIVKVTARVDDTLTVVRGVEGTTPSPFSTGVIAAHRLTAGAIATIAATGVAPVTSVAGRRGDILLGTADVAGFNAAAAAAAPVQLVAGRAGFVVLGTADITGFVASLGAASGIATLDSGGHLPLAQIPGAISSGRNYKGVWNANTNSPTLANGTGTAGDFYIATTAGTSLGATYAIGDQAIYNGATWDRSPANPGIGTMAAQNADSIDVTGGTALSMTALGVGADQKVPSTLPDSVWAVSDAHGNIAFYVDNAGVVRIGSLALFNTLTLTDFITSTATIAGNTITTGGLIPDLLGAIGDSSGNVVAGFRTDGTFVVSALASLGPITAEGKPVGSGGGGQADALNVTALGAVGDGVEAYCYVTTSTNTLTIGAFTGTLSLSQLTGTTAALSIVGTVGSGIAFQPFDVGKQLYLSVSGYVLQAPIIEYIDGQNIVLAASSITSQASVSGSCVWPSFLQADVGKVLVVDGMGQNSLWPNLPSSPRVADSTTAYGQQTFYAAISAVLSPVQVSVSGGNFPFTWASIPSRVQWGTDNGVAIAAAGQAAFAVNTRKLYFPGDGALYLATGMCDGGPARMNYGSEIGTDAGAALNGVVWIGDNSSVFACDQSGLQVLRRCAPNGADSSKWIRRSIHGRGTFRRCSQLTTINVLIVGDSQATPNPQKQAGAWMQYQHWVDEFKRANPGKTINFYNAALGGSVWAQLADPSFTVTNGYPQTGNWSVPRPISGTVPWQAFLTNINQTASGSPILPDCVYVGINTGNDSNNISGAAIQYIVNLIRSVNHGDGFGPADIILQTDQLTQIHTTSDGNTGGVSQPSALSNPWFNAYGAGLVRTTADSMGLGIVDLAPLVYRACFGYDQTVHDMRAVPVQSATATPAAPLAIATRCQNYTVRFTLTGASDAAAWASMKSLNFQTSVNRGGQAQFRVGPNGNIWCGVSAWGNWSAATVTIAAGGTSLTLATPTTLTGQTITQKAQWPQLHCVGAFSSGMVGSPIILPTGYQTGSVYRPQRNWVRGFYDADNVMLFDDCFAGQDIVSQTGASITIGPAWMPDDSFACPDVVILFPDGTIWNTQVAYGGYGSLTQANMATPSPQALTSHTVQMFIGRMAPKWFDTGLNIAGQTGAQGEFIVEINGSSLIMSYLNNQAGFAGDTPVFSRYMERFGAPFYPVLTPGASQQINIIMMYVDVAKPFTPSVTPVELRGVKDDNSDYAFGGVGGHPSSRLATNVTEPFYSSQNLSTW